MSELDPRTIETVVEGIVRQLTNAPAPSCGASGAAPTLPAASPCTGGASGDPSAESGDLLCLFNAGTRGVQHLVSAFQALHGEGRRIAACFSDCAEAVLSREELREKLGIHTFIEPVALGREMELLKNWPVLACPTFNRNALVKLATGSNEGFTIRLLFAALASHTAVLAVDDGLDCNNKVCADPALSLPGMDRILGGYRTTVEHFGLRFVSARQFAGEVALASGGGLTLKSEARIVTIDDVREFHGRVLVVSANAIVTAAARDLLASRGVEIRER